VPAVAGAVAFLCMTAVAGAVAIVEWLAAGEPFGARLTWKLAGLYVATFHGGGVDIRAGLRSGGTDAPPALAGVSTLHVTFLLGTILAGGALWRAGRSVGRRTGADGWRRMAWGAFIAPTYALLVFVVSLVIRLGLPTGGITDVRPVAWEAGLGALLLAVGAGAAGAAATEPMAERPGRLAAWLRGGWRMTVALVVLAFAGFLVVAGVRSDVSAAYVRGVSGSKAGVVAAVHHVLFLPDQSFLIAAPAMGSCLRLSGSGSQPTTLCLRTLTIRPGFGQLVLPPDASSAPVSLPVVWLLFLAVPAIATVWGGLAAGAGAGSALEAAIRGAGSGLVFAAAVVVGEGVSTIWITREPGGTILRLGADLARTGILACAWGIGGGVLGALLASRRQEPAGPAAEDPPPETPPSPTSV
jgi:hypothetical protein